ncbi:MAG: iron chaperone [Bilifractor sp.]|jgi:uncharacterized protein YdhG (YjbR/CyaY superfamily)
MIIDDYIASQRPEIQPQLREVYRVIHEVIPDAEEKIAWGMPTWKKKTNIIHFAAAKNHIGIYPGAKAVEHFSDELDRREYKYSKGAIQIPYKKPLPLDFIREIATWCRDNS